MRKINLSNVAKKRILIGVGCFVFVLVVALSIPKSVYEGIFKESDIKPVENVEEDGPTKLIYVLNKSKGLVGLNIVVEEESDDIIQKWDLLTSKSNTYPLGYYTPIETSTTLSKYEILHNKLTLVVSEDFLNSDGKNALASIAWTFCNDDIDEVVIKVDNNVINNLQGYTFNKIDRSINVNYVFETSYLFEADYLTILHNEGSYFIPVTYFFEEETSIDFMASKLLSDEIVSNKAYSFELNEKELTLNLASDDVLSTEVINEIRETIKLNYQIDSLTINNNVMTIYEEDFNVSNVSGGTIDNNDIDSIS